MQPIAIGNEQQFLKYCANNNIQLILFPKELEHTDNKNDGYHFIYEHELLKFVKSLATSPPSIVLLGSGDYHYITHGILREKIDKHHDGYTILLIDNHDDCTDIKANPKTFPYPINCASHMRESIKKSNALELIHVYRKDKAEADWYDKKMDKRKFLQATGDEPTERFTETMVTTLLDNIFSDVYLSIDIDALSHDEVDIEQYQAYDQGKMSLKELLLIVEMVCRSKNIIGVDICGMSKDKRAEQVYGAIIHTINGHS